MVGLKLEFFPCEGGLVEGIVGPRGLAQGKGIWGVVFPPPYGRAARYRQAGGGQQE